MKRSPANPAQFLEYFCLKQIGHFWSFYTHTFWDQIIFYLKKAQRQNWSVLKIFCVLKINKWKRESFLLHTMGIITHNVYNCTQCLVDRRLFVSVLKDHKKSHQCHWWHLWQISAYAWTALTAKSQLCKTFNGYKTIFCIYAFKLWLQPKSTKNLNAPTWYIKQGHF